MQRFLVVDPTDGGICAFSRGHDANEAVREYARRYGLYGIELAVMPASGISIERESKWTWVTCDINGKVKEGYCK